MAEFAQLGFDSVWAISAEHGLGVGDLLDAAFEGLARVPVEDEGEAPLRLALVGRPNVGKSSLLNRLIGEERAVVSAIPGTTRDSVDSTVVRDGRVFQFVDTAGIRRSRHLKENVDHVSVVLARRSLEHSDVGLIVLDAIEGIREMDATIAGYAVESNRGIVLVANKWDLARAAGVTQKAFTEAVRDELKFLAWAPLLFVSARTGSGLPAVLDRVFRVQQARRNRVTTGELNRVLARAQERQAPKADRGRGDVRILFGAQISVAPPTFAISLNQAVDLHFSYRRYLENQIRQAFGFEGTPLVLKVRYRRRTPRS
jgi:GTP-binding protein